MGVGCSEASGDDCGGLIDGGEGEGCRLCCELIDSQKSGLK